MFKEFIRNAEMETLLSYYFEDHKKFKDIIDQYPFISISGSLILMLLNRQHYDNADIDVYIHIDVDIQQLKKAISQLHECMIEERYYLKNHNVYRELNMIDFNMNPQLIDPTEFNPYWGMRNHIYRVTSYVSKKFCSTIQFIFIKTPIENMIINSFDLDIVKNFYCMQKVYVYAYRAIMRRIATIRKSHFIERICNGSEYEYTSFIQRYNKYRRRGFVIYIDNIVIEPAFMNYVYESQYNPDKYKLLQSFVIYRFVKKYMFRMKLYKYIHVLRQKSKETYEINDIISQLHKCKIKVEDAIISKKRKMIVI